jgi:protoporphyrinogen oxidase
MAKKAIIIGAGPAGLTAAYELLKRTDIQPVILEKSGDIGGISKTVNYKGNRIDIGGHRFFSKSDRVMKWWMNIMPLAHEDQKDIDITYRQQTRTISPNQSDDPARSKDLVLLVRQRLSRIYFLRKFFAYPIQLSLDTLKKLGLGRTLGILLSYTKARLAPRKPEQNLEDFFINRFGDTLYRLFFKDYTEKVWGVPCTQISAEWGAQRIKGISIAKAIQHAAKSLFPTSKGQSKDIAQKNTETSLIEKFLYPKYGPGQLWEEVARQVQEMGGEIHLQEEVKSIRHYDNEIRAIETTNKTTGQATTHEGDYFFSTMPVQELIADMGAGVPSNVREIAAGLQYRDFLTVGILLKKFDLPDTWIYIQEKDVKVGRLQIFNNWSPYMVKDPNTVWIGLEYFCNSTDAFWQQPDDAIKATAIDELERMGLTNVENILDTTILRMEKTYPAYFGAYSRFDEIRAYTDQFPNLFLVGRNGMHKYNNSDHSMLTAMVAVDNIAAGVTQKSNIWSINTEQEYHEEKKTTPALQKPSAKTQAPFKDYLLRDKENRAYRWAAFLGILLQFTIFKFLYPFAGFIDGDSYIYIQAAAMDWNLSIHPIGYSKFLRLFDIFSHSDTLLVAFQYLAIQIGAFFLLFTLFYIYKPRKWVKFALFTAVIFDPVFLYLSNYISSDALFLALSLAWFTTLIWILYKPEKNLIIWHSLFLILAFIIRYNALYYPLLSTFVFVLSPFKIRFKVAGIALSFLLIFLYIQTTSNSYKEYVGIREFTPFTGWQLANNAMYAYRYVENRDTANTPREFQALDRAVRTYFDTTRDVKKHPSELLEASTVYMWSPNSPLQTYMDDQFKKHDSSLNSEKRWSIIAPLYASYGSFLIKRYPAAYIKHYLWPNMIKYYAPPIEYLEVYNTGMDSVRSSAVNWFEYKSNKIHTAFKDPRVKTLEFYPILMGTLNVVFLTVLAAFIFIFGGRGIPYKNISLLIFALWVFNFVFSVIAAPIALRFQLFPSFASLALTLFLLDKIILSSIAIKNVAQPNLALS